MPRDWPYTARPERTIKGALLSRQQIYYEGHHLMTLQGWKLTDAVVVAECMNMAFTAGKTEAETQARLREIGCEM